MKIKSTTTASHTVTSESLKNISQQDTNSPMDLAKEPLKTNSTDIEEIASKAVIHIKKQVWLRETLNKWILIKINSKGELNN